jgi:enoyl-CoA hydratase
MDEMGQVSARRDGSILVIRIERAAKRNSFTPPMMQELGAALTELANDPALRCGVLCAEGDHFTAGLDLMAFLPTMAEGAAPTPESGIDALQLRAICPKPLVAAVRGITFTVGIELMLACDLAIAGASTRFAQLETRRGIMVSGGGTVRWVQRAGLGNAMYHLLRGDEFGADEAMRIGLVQEVVPDADVLDRAMTLANEIAANAPLAVQATKASVASYLSEGQQAAFAALGPAQAKLVKSADATEGAMAMMQKRQPLFQGA